MRELRNAHAVENELSEMIHQLIKLKTSIILRLKQEEAQEDELEQLFSLSGEITKRWKGSTDAVEVIREEREKRW